MHRRGRIGIVIVVACLAAPGCSREAVADAPATLGDASDKSGRPTSVSKREPIREGLVIGEFRLPPNPVVDGDTIRVEDLEGSIRLLSIDTEEKARSKRDRAAIKTDFDGYLKAKRGNSVRPVKAATPLGEEATEFAELFFDGAEMVRLERDDQKSLRGRFGRALAYAFVQKDGKWTSFNVEAVRAGMTPYFTKYGYSHRFHNQFARAEAEARRAGRGIWNPDAKGYGDYAERKNWWDARANFIRAFEHASTGRDDRLMLTDWDAETRLGKDIGREVSVLGTISDIKYFKGLVRVRLAEANKRDFPIIFKDRAVFEKSGIDRYRGEPIIVRGLVERYTRGSYETLQIVVRKSEQITLPTLPWPERRTEQSETNRTAGR